LRKSLSIIVIMGIVAMVLIVMMMNSFLSRVGSANALPRLREDLLARHGVVFEDESSLKIAPKRRGDGEEARRWLIIEFRPKADLARSRVALERRMRMMARQVYAQPKYEKRYDFIDVQAQTDAEVVEIRVTREEALTRVGRTPPPAPPSR
jgi:hypothetical protein